MSSHRNARNSHKDKTSLRHTSTINPCDSDESDDRNIVHDVEDAE